MKTNMNETYVMGFVLVAVLLCVIYSAYNKWNDDQDYRTALLGTKPVRYSARRSWNHFLQDREYEFEFRYCYNSWRAYVTKQPRQLQGICREYLFNDNGAYYIYHSDSVHSLDKMMKIARKWADEMQKAG